MTMSALPLNLPDLAEVLGDMPPGDAPKAWWVSQDPDVLTAWDLYATRHEGWLTAWDHLLSLSGLPASTKRITQGSESDILIGLVPPSGARIPAGWRKNAQGYLVPRKRTIAEKTSQVSQLFGECADIPRAVLFMPGLPSALCADQVIYPVVVRKPAQAVTAFVGHDPEVANPSFVVGPQWTEMKVSTFFMLRERQS